jgi:hypothetical protein
MRFRRALPPYQRRWAVRAPVNTAREKAPSIIRAGSARGSMWRRGGPKQSEARALRYPGGKMGFVLMEVKMANERRFRKQFP